MEYDHEKGGGGRGLKEKEAAEKWRKERREEKEEAIEVSRKRGEGKV